MTPSQTWQAVVDILTETTPSAKAVRKYALDEDIEELHLEERPLIAVVLTGSTISSVTTDARTTEDTYTFALTIIWKLKAENNTVELDTRLDQAQYFMKSLRHRYFDVDGSRIFLGLPTCDTPYDIDMLRSPGVFLSTFTIPVTVYHNVD